MPNQYVNRYLAPLETWMQVHFKQEVTNTSLVRMMQYAMGWTQANGKPYDKPTGKRLRPTLLLLVVESFGGDWQQALPAAAAIETLHNFSLIHDDIQDRSITRHGRPTVWQVWGENHAINAGDAMFSLAYTFLAKLQANYPIDLVLAVWETFNQTNLELTRGQYLDMQFENETYVATDEYISMISGKSAALIAACAKIGALLATNQYYVAESLSTFGLNLGIAFQIRDDVLGIWGDPQVTGKSAASDIVTKKKSLPVLYGLEQSEELQTLYQRQEFDKATVTEVLNLLNSIQSQEYTVAQEALYHQRAITALEEIPDTTLSEDLRDFVDRFFRRTN